MSTATVISCSVTEQVHWEDQLFLRNAFGFSLLSLYMRESSAYMSGTPANVLRSWTTFRIAVICQQKGHRAGRERVSRKSHSRWLMCFYWWHLAILLNFLWLLCCCLCWFGKRWVALVLVAEEEVSTNSRDGAGLHWCKVPAGMVIFTRLTFQSEEFQKSQWEWCKMKCCNPNETQPRFIKEYFFFVFIQSN